MSPIVKLGMMNVTRCKEEKLLASFILNSNITIAQKKSKILSNKAS